MELKGKGENGNLACDEDVLREERTNDGTHIYLFCSPVLKRESFISAHTRIKRESQRNQKFSIIQTDRKNDDTHMYVSIVHVQKTVLQKLASPEQNYK